MPAQEETKEEDDDKGEDEDGENELPLTIRPKRASSSRTTTTTKKQQQQGSGSASILLPHPRHGDVPSLPPSLKLWVARRVQQDRIVKTAYNKLVKVRHILVSLQPSLPSSRFSTPASLQAAFLQPAAQQALLLFYRQNKAGRKAGTTVGNALMSFKAFLQIARLELREGGGGREGGQPTTNS